MDLLLFEDAAVEYRAKRAPKVSRKVHDPDSILFYEPSEQRIAAVMAFHGIGERDEAIRFAQAMRAEILAMPLKEPLKWGPKRREAMAAIERANDALKERQAELAAMAKEIDPPDWEDEVAA